MTRDRIKEVKKMLRLLNKALVLIDDITEQERADFDSLSAEDRCGAVGDDMANWQRLLAANACYLEDIINDVNQAICLIRVRKPR